MRLAKEQVGPQNHGNQPELKVTMIDLSGVETRRKNMLDACVTIDWREYVAETSALAVPLLIQVAKEAGVANNKPVAFEVGAIEGKPGTVALFPRDQRSEQYLKATWFDSGSRCRLDFHKLMTLLKFEIHRNTTAVIPVKVGTYGKKACLEVYFSQAEFQPIEEGKRKKAKKAEAGADKAAAQAKEQAAPAQAPTKPAEAPSETNP